MLLFGVLLVLWSTLIAWFTLGFYVLGGSWLDWVYALDPRDLHPTEWWFWFSVIVIPPVAILAGLMLANVGRWRTALLIVPAAVSVIAVGGVTAYAIDQLFI